MRIYSMSDLQYLKIKTKLIFVLAFILINANAFAQTDTTHTVIDTTEQNVKVIPGKQYDIGWFSKLFVGEHWRSLWKTEFDAKVLNLSKFAGGLTPVKKGGGLQTKSLRLKGNDGNEYKFRTIDKDPSRSLPPELQNSVYSDLLQDQVSIGLPVSPLIVYPMMKATGILAVEPKIVVMPDYGLGDFEKDFSGALGIIEQNPIAGKEGYNNFENADKVVNGFKIFKQIEKDNDEQVDPPRAGGSPP